MRARNNARNGPCPVCEEGDFHTCDLCRAPGCPNADKKWHERLEHYMAEDATMAPWEAASDAKD